jgi:hypothetical protein
MRFARGLATRTAFLVVFGSMVGTTRAVEPFCDFGCVLPFDIEVHLEWRPESLHVLEGETIEIGLYAVPSNTEVEAILAGVQFIINWDPSQLVVSDSIDNGPYDWLLSGFNNDSVFDNFNNGISTPPFGVPFNDGDAFYEALAQFPPPLGQGPAVVPTGGLLVSTFEFTAGPPTDQTTVAIPFSAGCFTCTAAFWGANDVAGCDVKGRLGEARIRINSAPVLLGDGDIDGDVDIEDFVVFEACAISDDNGGTLTEGCLIFDFDVDLDVDLADFGQFQSAFGT